MTSNTAPAAPAGPANKPSLAERLTAAGPLYVEIGHALSLRPDLVPAAEWQALRDLPLRHAALPAGTAVELVTAALGRPPGEVFDSFELLPARSEPLVQTHNAVLDGEDVQVKLLRPDARKAVSDAARWRRELQKALGRGRSDADASMAEDVEQWLRRRIDLRGELRMLESVAQRSTSRREVVPKTYPDMSGSDLLVMQRLGGTSLAHLLAPGLPGSNGTAAAPPLDDGEGSIGRIIVHAVLGQLLGGGWMQTDFVASNVVLLPSGQLSYFDFCNVVDVPASMVRQQLDFLTAVFDRDVVHMFPLLDRDRPGAAGDLADFRRVLLRSVDHLADDGDEPSGGAQPPVVSVLATRFLVELLRLSSAWRVGLASGTPPIYGALAAALGYAADLDGADAVDAAAQRVLRNARLQAITRSLRSEELETWGAGLVALARDSPGHAHQLLADLSDGSFSLNVSAAESPLAARSHDARARIVVAAICAVGLSVLATTPHLPQPGGVSLGWPLGVALGALYTWIFLAWRRMS